MGGRGGGGGLYVPCTFRLKMENKYQNAPSFDKIEKINGKTPEPPCKKKKKNAERPNFSSIARTLAVTANRYNFDAWGIQAGERCRFLLAV